MAGHNLFDGKGGNGSSFHNSKVGYKQPNRYEYPLMPIDGGLFANLVKRIRKMAEAKFLIFLGNWIGFPLFGYVLYINWGTTEAWLLLFISFTFGLVKIGHGIARLVFYIIEKRQEAKMKDMDIEDRKREQEKEWYDE